MSDQPDHDVSPGAQMRPGQHVQEAPFAAVFHVVTRPDGERRLILHVEHATGALLLPMSLEAARTMLSEGIKQIDKAEGKPTGGITVADITDLRRLQQGGA